jgi:hypothetical protein
MNNIVLIIIATGLMAASFATALTAYGITPFEFNVDGTDAIFLAGRDDVVIPALGSSFILARHGFVNPDFEQETFPDSIPVVGGQIITFSDPAIGGIHFFNGLGGPFYGPEGDTSATSSLTSLGGISGYLGTSGALVGVFLDGTNPALDLAPSTLDFSTALLRDFTSISPQLNQVFFIGDGFTSGAVQQEFIAPPGATRLFLGIPDGFNFNGPPGAYEDNDGEYTIKTSADPDPILVGGTSIPIDTTTLLLAGVQSTAPWLMPALVAGAGFVIVIRKKL